MLKFIKIDTRMTTGISYRHRMLKSAVVLHISAVILAWASAYFFRFTLTGTHSPAVAREFLFYLPLLIFVNVFFHQRKACYNISNFSPWHKKVTNWISSSSRSFVIFICIYFYTNRTPITRLGLLYFITSLVIYEIIVLTIVSHRERMYHKSNEHKQRLLFIGNGKQLEDFIKSVIKNSHNVSIMGWFNPDQEQIPLLQKYNIPSLDLAQEQFPDFVAEQKITHIFIGFKGDKNEISTYSELFSATYCDIYILPILRSTILGYSVEDILHSPAILLNASRTSTTMLFTKRLIDIVGSIVGLILFSPIFLILGILVKLSSPGKIFYGQERITLNNRPFIMWKFRSMASNAETKTGAVWATKQDTRVTPLGRFMRSTSLDEIPQFWNVLKGDLSLVGPRPERPVFVEQFKQEIPGYGIRHRMKAGITGWAQINGLRGDTSIVKRSAYDNQYVRNWTILWDLRIILLTFVHGFLNDNAY